MLDAAAERNRSREREEWRRSLIVTQAAMNIMAKKPKELTYLADRMLRDDVGSVLPMPIEEYRAMIREAHKKAMAKAGATA